MKTLVFMHVWERAAWSTFPDSCWSQPGSWPVPKLCLYQKTKWKLVQLSGEFDLCQQAVYIVQCSFKTCFLFGRRYFLWIVQKLWVSVQGISLCAFLERLLQIKVGICFFPKGVCAGVYCHWARMAWHWHLGIFLSPWRNLPFQKSYFKMV